MRHAIEDLAADTCFDLLSQESTRPQFGADDALVAGHAGFSQGAAMIADVFFPSFSALSLDGSHPLIAGLDVAIPPFGCPFTGIALGRDHRFDRHRLPLGWIGQDPMDLPPIIGPIAIAPRHGLWDLPQQRLDLRGIVSPRLGQRVGHHLAGVGIDAQMQFTPGPALGPPMLPDFPFTLPVDFQSRTIDNQMDRLPGRFDRQVHRQPGCRRDSVE